jgi:hypothetical protein
MSPRYGRHAPSPSEPASQDAEAPVPAADAAADNGSASDGAADVTDAGAPAAEGAAAQENGTGVYPAFTPPQPTFTAAPGGPAQPPGTVLGPAYPLDGGPWPVTQAPAPGDPATAEPPAGSGLRAAPDDVAYAESATAASPLREHPAPAPGTAARSAASTDRPLLRDSTGLRQRWQQVQSEFVDDPREAVGNAAELIEQATQALFAALRHRKRELRASWDTDPDTANRTADTEQLRLAMQRYRALFNQLCRS